MEQWKGENLSKLMIKKMWNKKEKGIRLVAKFFILIHDPQLN